MIPGQLCSSSCGRRVTTGCGGAWGALPSAWVSSARHNGSPAAAGAPVLSPSLLQPFLPPLTLVLRLLSFLTCFLLGQGPFPFLCLSFSALPQVSLCCCCSPPLLTSLVLCPSPPPALLTVTSRAASSPSSGGFPVPWQLSKQQPSPFPILSTIYRVPTV